MPYVDENSRCLYEILNEFPDLETKGDLEYCITFLMKVFMRSRQWRFSDLHDAVYAAQHCADEFRRRALDVREDEAIEINGDVNVPRDPHFDQYGK